MRNFIIYFFLFLGSIPFGAGAQMPQLQDKAPTRYVVEPGDTLWDISARFLKDPWKWPEIWGMNREEIENPHLIYPGDVIVLENDGGKPRLRIEQGGQQQEQSRETVRLSPGVQIRDLGRAIASIPLSAIGPFLSRTHVVSKEAWENAPKLIAGEDERYILGAGESAYVSGLSSEKNFSWDLYKKGREYVDPETGKFLGLEVDYLGEAKLVKLGDPSKIEITRSEKEIGMDARLLPPVEQTITHFVPHAPDRPVKGRILSSEGAVSEIGQNDIVTLDLGSRDGVELGDVLAVYHPGRKAGDTMLPDQRIGLVLVFRTYDRLSYALVVQSALAIHIAETVQTP